MEENNVRNNADTDIKVSVIVITYNHEKYIRHALDSILMQKTDFKYEILIGDDASIDSTPKILEEYREKYPDRIKLTLRKKNVGSTKNSYELYMQAKGEYISTLEGDDFWTNENKLQIQSDFLDKHAEYIGCSCDIDVVDEFDNIYDDISANAIKDVLFSQNKEYGIEEYNNSFMPGHACTLVYRNFFHDIDASILYNAHRIVGDITIAMLLAVQGVVYRIDKRMAGYRRNRMGSGSSWSASTASNIFHLYELFMFHSKLEEYAWKNFRKHTSLKKRKQNEFYHMVEEMILYPSKAKKRCVRKMFFATQEKLVYVSIFIKTIYLSHLAHIVKQAIGSKNLPDQSDSNCTSWKQFRKRVKGKRVILFGGGGGCVEFLKKYYGFFDIDYVVDNLEQRQGNYVMGYKILGPQILESEDKERIAVLVTPGSHINEINKQLEDYGIHDYYSYVLLESGLLRYFPLKVLFKDTEFIAN